MVQAEICEWMCDYQKSQAFASLVEDTRRFDVLTGYDAIAMLRAIIARTRPRLVVEIGTFFAQTTRVLAEDMLLHGSGRIITVDPFGAERMPGILAGWPPAAAHVVDFRPVNSMALFMDLEGSADRPDLVFIDGNHAFAYARYDIQSSADVVASGGVLFVDNMEQRGPAAAVEEFCADNPAWALFYNGNIWDGQAVVEQRYRQKWRGNYHWGVLIAPDGRQVGRHGLKYSLGLERGREICAVKLNLAAASAPAVVDIDLSLNAVPFDFHLTGRGLRSVRRQLEGLIAASQDSVQIELETPLSVRTEGEEYNFFFEAEVILVDGSPFLLRSDRPVELVAA